MKNNKARSYFLGIAASFLLLSACRSVTPPPPLTAHFDESSGRLEVDCVVTVGDADTAVPAMFRFSAQLEANDGINEDSTVSRYRMDSVGPVLIATTGQGCPNHIYYRSSPGSEVNSAELVLPEVQSSSGKRYELDLFHFGAMARDEFTEIEKYLHEDLLDDITVTAGATVSIPVPAAYDVDPTLYLRHVAGRHSPEVIWSGTQRTLDITGVGPGIYTLTAVFSRDYTLFYEESIAITVCADGDDLDDCNSDPRDCDCLATDQRLATELAVREALVRYQLSDGLGAGDVPRMSAYCLQIEPVRFYSNEQGQVAVERFGQDSAWNWLYVDPPAELLNRFSDKQEVKSASQCSRRSARGVFELDSGQSAVYLVSGAISWQGDDRVVMEGGYYQAGLSAAGAIFTLERVDGTWRVVAMLPVWHA